MPKPNALGDASRTCSGSTAGRRGDHTATRAVGWRHRPAWAARRTVSAVAGRPSVTLPS